MTGAIWTRASPAWNRRAIVPASVLGKDAPSSKIHVGQIGCGRIARGHDLPEVMKYDVARVVAVCDIWPQRAQEAKAYVDGINGDTHCKAYHDYREMIADPEVDIVGVAVPDHWHSLLTILSCQAGKDVYVEKPCSHNVFEGRKCVEAARKYKRIVQHGTQSRSDKRWAKLAEIAGGLVLAGEISIIGSLAAGDFAQAHGTYGRKQDRDA